MRWMRQLGLRGEDARAGRWWWENPDTRECGLHVSSEAKV
jgi:3'-phosphoadenosine 5'-phosphosulfate sulfotransferase (PAPS reductase)/FAD synthetase